jgi:hypothetical protein
MKKKEPGSVLYPVAYVYKYILFHQSNMYKTELYVSRKPKGAEMNEKDCKIYLGISFNSISNQSP